MVKTIYRKIQRYRVAKNYFKGLNGTIFKWLLQSNEISNFTYDLTDKNYSELAHVCAVITDKPEEEIKTYIDEIRNNNEIKSIISESIRENKDPFADLEVHFGRRVGWYAIARAMKPKVILETGVDKGHGSLVLTSALIENAKEGVLGKYFGTDINPKAGYLLQGKFKEYGSILYGDSIESIGKLNEIIDLYINDSDHSSEYEEREYAAMKDKLSDNAVILGDNSHVTDKLAKFSTENGRKFILFNETPKDHWYPGAGIGFSFK